MEIHFNFEELRKNKLFIATPMYGGNASGMYVKSILDLHGLLMSQGIENRFSFLFNESLIPRARNYLVDEFLRTDYTHFLFLDADIEFNPIDVVALMHFNKDIIGGPYPKKTIKWSNIDKAYQIAAERNQKINPAALHEIVGEYVFNPVPGTVEFNSSELLEVMEIGTGYMMIKRNVFDHYREEFPHLRYKPDHAGQSNFDGQRYIHAYFDTAIDPDTHRYLSEDYFFCQNARSIGHQIWYCPWMQTTHVGTYGFKGNIQAISHMVGSMG